MLYFFNKVFTITTEFSKCYLISTQFYFIFNKFPPIFKYLTNFSIKIFTTTENFFFIFSIKFLLSQLNFPKLLLNFPNFTKFPQIFLISTKFLLNFPNRYFMYFLTKFLLQLIFSSKFSYKNFNI